MSNEIAKDYMLDMIGRQREASDQCALPLVQRLAALLNYDPSQIRDGNPLPFGWHGFLFAPCVPQSQLATDGTLVDDLFLTTPAGFPRRVAGGRRIDQNAPIRIGSKVTRRSYITSVLPKDGRSGPFIVATVRHEIFAEDTTPAIIEEIDTIFRRPASNERSDLKKDRPHRLGHSGLAQVSEHHMFTSIELFRFSAVVFNSHRIHFDWPYATEVEGYPDIVVNGSISALFLLNFAERRLNLNPKRAITRNLRPLYVNRPVQMCAVRSDSEVILWVEDKSGEIAVEVKVTEEE